MVPDLAPFDASMTLRLKRRMVGVRAELPAYLHLLAERRVRLVHAHFGPGAIHALPLLRRTGLPLVVTFHGYDVTRLPQQPGSRGRRYRGQLSEVFERADRLIAVSRHIEARLLDLGAPASKVVVRYLGAPAARAPLSAQQSRTGIVFVGRLVEKKGIGDLLQAVAALPGELRSTPVWILGTGELLGPLQRLARSLHVDATFHGPATPAEVSAALSGAAVYCAPSKTARDADTEGLPITLIEAAHHGATIVTTAHAGIPELLTDGRDALMVAEGDIAGLTTALARALTDRRLAGQLAERAKARVLGHFELGACTAALEDLYDAVVARPLGAGGEPADHAR